MSKDKVLEARRKAARYAEALATPATRLEHASRPSLQRRLFYAITRLDRTGTVAGFFQTRHYRNAVPTRIEAPRAVLAHDTAAAVLNDTLEQFQQGRGLDAARLKSVVGPLIDSILRNQDAMAWLVCLRKREVAWSTAVHRQRRLGVDPRSAPGLRPQRPRHARPRWHVAGSG